MWSYRMEAGKQSTHGVNGQLEMVVRKGPCMGGIGVRNLLAQLQLETTWVH